MIHEEICTYEVCKLARDKGFDVPTDRYYHLCNDVIEAQNSLEMTGDGCADFYNSLNQCRCAAPTQSLLQRWLREEKGIHISVEYEWVEGIEDWTFYAYIKKVNNAKVVDDAINSGFDTYELALEDALKYTLENLVI